MRWLNKLFASSAASLLMLAGVILGGSGTADAVEGGTPRVPTVDSSNQDAHVLSYIEVGFTADDRGDMPGPTWE